MVNNSASIRLVCQAWSPRLGPKLTRASTVSGYPKLIEVTLEELETGLEGGKFTSVDLVNVSRIPLPCQLMQ